MWESKILKDTRKLSMITVEGLRYDGCSRRAET